MQLCGKANVTKCQARPTVPKAKCYFICCVSFHSLWPAVLWVWPFVTSMTGIWDRPFGLHWLKDVRHDEYILRMWCQSETPDWSIGRRSIVTFISNGQFPLDVTQLRYVSATPVELIGFTLVYVLIPTRSAALRICSIPAPAVRSPLEQIRRTSISGGCRSMTQQFSWI